METKINAEWAKSKGLVEVKRQGTYYEFNEWQGIINGVEVGITSHSTDGVYYCTSVNGQWSGKGMPSVYCWIDTEEKLLKAIEFCKNFSE